MTSYDDAFDDASILARGHQFSITFIVLGLVQLGPLLQHAAGDVPVIYADNSDRSLLVCVLAVLLASAAPKIAEFAPSSVWPVRKPVLLDVRRRREDWTRRFSERLFLSDL